MITGAKQLQCKKTTDYTSALSVLSKEVLMSATLIAPEQLIGTWRLVATTAFDKQGRPMPSPWGPEPMGRIVFTKNGRMMAVLCDGRSSTPGGGKRAYSSYCGNYRVENNTLITLVDAAAVADRIGGEQRRRLEFRSGQLVLMPPSEPNGERRELFWELNGPA
jgi:Lipocalin-like domain